MKEGREILVQFRNRWQLLLYVEAAIYALGFGFFLGSISGNPLIGALGALLAGLVSLFIRKPWIKDLERSAAYVDTRISTAG